MNDPTNPSKMPGTPPAQDPAETPPAAAANVETPPETPPTKVEEILKGEPTDIERDFDGLAKEFEADDVGNALEVPEQEKGAKEELSKPKAEEVPPKVDEPPQPKVEEVPPKEKPPEEPVKPAAEEVPPKPAEEPKKPEELIKIAPEEKPVEVTPEQVSKDRTDLTNHWEKSYEMTPEEGIEFLDSPHEIVPKAMARLHVAVLEDAVKAIGQLLPQIVAREVQTIKTTTAHDKAFYDKWRKLDTPEYRKVVTRMGDLYKQHNPDATVEQFIQEVGAAAMIAFKIPPDDIPGESPAALDLVPPAAPAREQHSPVQPGSGTPPAAPAKKLNEFETLAVEFEEDDRGHG